MLSKFTLGLLAVTAAAAAFPDAADARGRYDRGYGYSYADPYYRGGYGYDRGYYDRGYYGRGYDRRYYGRRNHRRCGDGTTGAIVGGAAGALLGREVARGDRRGYRYRRDGNGAAGALIGREIGRSC